MTHMRPNCCCFFCDRSRHERSVLDWSKRRGYCKEHYFIQIHNKIRSLLKHTTDAAAYNSLHLFMQIRPKYLIEMQI